jgi:hypothetical protein
VTTLDDLFEMTEELRKTLQAFSDKDPYGTPSESAARVFYAWLDEAGPLSTKPGHYADVRANYIVLDNTNRDLFDLLNMLHQYIEYPEPEVEEKLFIGLPVL